jgi:hypothetical protein
MSTSTDQQRTRKEGFVYILKSAMMPNIYKIGRTSRSLYERIEELSGSTGVPVSFDLLCAMFVKDSYLVEQYMHESLSTQRVSSSREFFKLNSDSEAKKIFLSVLSENVEQVESFGLDEQDSKYLYANILQNLKVLADQKNKIEDQRKHLELNQTKLSNKANTIREIMARDNAKIEEQKRDQENILYLYKTFKKDRANLFAYLRREQKSIDPEIIRKIKEIFLVKELWEI